MRHALSASVAALAATQILRDLIEIDREAGGHAVDDGHEARGRVTHRQ